MKALLALASYEIGGAATVARNIINIFTADKHDTTLLVEKLAERHYPIDEAVKLIDLDMRPKRRAFAKAINLARHIFSMRKNIRRESPDLVVSFATQTNCYVLLSLLFIFKKRPKVIITEHSEEMFVMPRMFYRALMNLLYHRADYIIAVSKSIAGHAKSLFLVSPDKIKVIYNSVNISKVRQLCLEGRRSTDPEDRMPHIGTVTRLSPEKGIQFLIKGFRHLLDKTEARLVIVGDGAERPRLEKLARDLGIKEKVIFTGWVDNPFKYLSRIDIFVLPSLWEGFPNVILEAMACRVPVIASDASGGIRETIKDGINGVFIKPGSFSDIAISVYDLLTNKAKREKIIEEAYQTVQEFDISKIRNQYNSLIYS